MDLSSKGPTRPNKDTIHQEKLMHVLYTNADCSHNKLSQLILLIESLKHKPNIIVITEFKDKCVIKIYLFKSLVSRVTYCNVMISRASLSKCYYSTASNGILNS